MDAARVSRGNTGRTWPIGSGGPIFIGTMAQTPKGGESNKPRAPIWGEADRTTKLWARPSKISRGKKLGEINDLVIDSQGHVPLAILTHGGFWGMGEKLFAVPFSSLNFDQWGRITSSTQMEKSWILRPLFRISDLSHKKWLEGVYRFFGQPPYWIE